MKMGASCFSENFVPLSQITRRLYRGTLHIETVSSSSIMIVISYSSRLLEETYLKINFGTNRPKFKKKLSLEREQNAVHKGYIHR
jgi:hypothetical protein